MIIPLVIAAFAVTITLFYASYRDIQERRVPFRTWYPMMAITIPAALVTYGMLGIADSGKLIVLIAMVGIFSLLFYLFAAFGLFGGADAWALIFIAVFIPLFPVEPLFGYPPLGFLPFTVLTNAVLINLIAPLGIFIWNISRGRRAPFPYLFFGYPASGEHIEDAFGFVMEEIEERDGVITRRFIRIRELLARMLKGQRTLYTKMLKMHPDQYREERELFRRAGHVWILYGIPFIVPITAGLITAIFLGDILYWLMKIGAGV
jgi:archaeal preflagellin peptidase FlaK